LAAAENWVKYTTAKAFISSLMKGSIKGCRCRRRVDGGRFMVSVSSVVGRVGNVTWTICHVTREIITYLAALRLALTRGIAMRMNYLKSLCHVE
jgi:hypothetical protein